MNCKTIIQQLLETAQTVAFAYLNDLSDAELLQRPHSGCNSINWQIGHLILSEHQQMEQLSPGCMPPLPDRFGDVYSSPVASEDDPGLLLSKDLLLETYQKQRSATLALLEEMTDEQLETSTGVSYAPTIAAMIQMQGAHWLMHCGQWVVVRRMNDKPVVI